MSEEIKHEMVNEHFGDSFIGTRDEIENAIIDICKQNPDGEQFSKDDFQANIYGKLMILTEDDGWQVLAIEID